MYKDEIRDDFIKALYENVEELSTEELNQVLCAFDKTLLNYEVFSTKDLNSLGRISEDSMPPIYHEFLECRREEGAAEGTLTLMSHVLRNFFIFIKDKENLNDVKPNDIRCFLTAYKATHNVSNRTLDLYRIEVCGFFKWASAEDYIDKNPGERIHKIKYVRNERQFLTEDQLEAFRETAENIRDAAMIEFMYSTGCRVAEFCAVKKSDVNFETGEVRLFGKGSKYRTSYLNAKAIRMVKKYLNTRQDDCEYLFCSLRRPFRQLQSRAVDKRFNELSNKCYKEVGINITPHILRHTMASHAIQRGMAPELIQQILGHTNINTTMIYAKVLEKDVKTMHNKVIV